MGEDIKKEIKITGAEEEARLTSGEQVNSMVELVKDLGELPEEERKNKIQEIIEFLFKQEHDLGLYRHQYQELNKQVELLRTEINSKKYESVGLSSRLKEETDRGNFRMEQLDNKNLELEDLNGELSREKEEWERLKIEIKKITDEGSETAGFFCGKEEQKFKDISSML